MIKYIVFNGKVELCPTREFSSVLRAACSVLRAACSVLRVSMNWPLRSVYSRPERRPRVGRICDKDLKCITAFIVGRIESAARRPHAADLASDCSDQSDGSAACGRWRNGSETLEYDSVTSFDDAADI